MDDAADLEGKAADALNGLGFGHWESADLIKKHDPLSILAAEERLRLTEQERQVSAPRKFFLAILEGTKRSCGHNKLSKEPPWVVELEVRKRQWLEQCQGCQRAAEMMPSYLIAVENLARADATRLPGAPRDDRLGKLVDEWVEAIDSAIAAFKGEPWPRSPLAVRIKECKAGVERFASMPVHKGTTLSEPAFEARRQALLQQARAVNKDAK